MTHPFDFELTYPPGGTVVIGTAEPDGAGGWLGTLALWSDGHRLLSTEAVVKATLIDAQGGTLLAPTSATYGGPGWWYYEIDATLLSQTSGTIDAYLICYAADGTTLKRTFHGRLYNRGA